MVTLLAPRTPTLPRIQLAFLSAILNYFLKACHVLVIVGSDFVTSCTSSLALDCPQMLLWCVLPHTERSNLYIYIGFKALFLLLFKSMFI